MQKRGQIYLLAALIIGFILFTLVAQSNSVKKTLIEDDFEDLSKNYERESAYFVNGLLESNAADFAKEFLKFTVLFTSFSKTKNPEFGLIYAFLYEKKLYVGNYLDTPITLKNYPPPNNVLVGCYDLVETSVSLGGLKVNTGSVTVSTFKDCTLKPPNNPPPGNKLVVVIEDIEYEITLTKDNPEVMIVTREEKDKQRKVFMKGNFIKGKGVDL